MAEYPASFLAFFFTALAYIATGLIFLLSHFPPEKSSFIFLSTIENLLSLTLFMMTVPILEMLTRSVMSIMVYRIDQSMELKKIAALLIAYETKKETTTTTTTESTVTASEKAYVEMCTMMKTLLKLEIEKYEAMKRIRESTPSVDPSITASATPSVSNEEIKSHEEGASSRSAAQTVV
jgi:hypothetical protein